MAKVFAIRDVKGDCFAISFIVSGRGVACRQFVDLLCAPKSPVALHPEDYSLYGVGEFNESSGELKGLSAPEFVMSAVEALEMVRKDQERFQPSLPGVEREVAG